MTRATAAAAAVAMLIAAAGLARKDAHHRVQVSAGSLSAAASTVQRVSTAPRPTWHRLPTLPFDGPLDGGGIASTRDGLVVAAVSNTKTGAAMVRVWLRTDTGWRRLSPKIGLPVDKGSRVHLVDQSGTCIVRELKGNAALLCLRAGHWRQRGDEIFTRGERGLVGNAFTLRGELYVSYDLQPHVRVSVGGAGLEGRIEAHVAKFASSAKWFEPVPGDLDAASNGNLRSSGFDANGRACVGYQALPVPDASRSDPGPTVNIRCLSNGAWSAAGPVLTPAAIQQVGSYIEYDNADAANSGLYVGLDVHHARDTDYLVMRRTPAGWESAGLGGATRAWNEQGTLYHIAGTVWSVRFDQRTTPRGLAARLTIRRPTSDGRGEQVGGPLLDGEIINGPIYYGLAASGTHVFALGSVPAHHANHNTLVVYELRSGR